MGCDGKIGPSSSTGTYTLRTVNGSSLPAVISGSGSNKTEVLDDTIILYDGLTYAKTAHLRVTAGSDVSTVTSTETGSFTLFGTSITLQSSNGLTQRIGLIDGYDMTFVVNGLTSVYTK